MRSINCSYLIPHPILQNYPPLQSITTKIVCHLQSISNFHERGMGTFRDLTYNNTLNQGASYAITQLEVGRCLLNYGVGTSFET